MGDSNFAEGYAIGRDSNNGYGNGAGMWGNDAWWIVILLIFGWGNNGWGGGFGGNGGALTRSDLCQDMNFNNLEGAVRGVQQGLCDGFYAMNTGMLNGFAGVQQTLCQGFGGVNTGLMQQGYETRGAITDLGYRLQDCCCQTQRAIDAVNYNMAKNTCDIQNSIATSTRDIVDGQRASTDAILGFLTNEKISSLQAENAALTAQLSQNSQTQTIINTLRPVASPAYITCSPYESAYGYGRGGYGNNCGCGCGCNG